MNENGHYKEHSSLQTQLMLSVLQASILSSDSNLFITTQTHQPPHSFTFFTRDQFQCYARASSTVLNLPRAAVTSRATSTLSNWRSRSSFWVTQHGESCICVCVHLHFITHVGYSLILEKETHALFLHIFALSEKVEGFDHLWDFNDCSKYIQYI